MITGSSGGKFGKGLPLEERPPLPQGEYYQSDLVGCEVVERATGQSLGRVVGPLWAGSLFDFHITLPYLSAAVIMLVALFYGLYAMRAETGPALVSAPALDPLPHE